MSRLAFPFRPAENGRSDTVGYGSPAHVRQMLELLIFTVPSERVMRPDFGSPVMQMVFGAGNGPAALALEATLQAAITQWLGHLLELHDLTVAFHDQDAVLEVAVTYEVRSSKTVDSLSVRKAAA